MNIIQVLLIIMIGIVDIIVLVSVIVAVIIAILDNIKLEAWIALFCIYVAAWIGLIFVNIEIIKILVL